MEAYAYSAYYTFAGARFFTMVLKPSRTGKFPAVITRSPYVAAAADTPEETLLAQFTEKNLAFARRGYVLVFQHCRGQGKSTGEFVPYIREREDGRALWDWVRAQDFYNGQLFLLGGSYTASLHYSTAPFARDILAAVFNVQDSERYRLWYRNGCMRRGHADWHFKLYKAKSGLHKTFTPDSFSERPLQDLSLRALGERAEDFEEMLTAPRIEAPFWQTRYGGVEARGALDAADIPILLTTGYNDFYIGGMFRMWNEMQPSTRAKCAMLVSPYNHGQSYHPEKGLAFPGGSLAERFGGDLAPRWFDAVLKGEKPFVPTGKVAYYRAFEGKWAPDFYAGETGEITLSLSGGAHTLLYRPNDPPSFVPEGYFMPSPDGRADVLTLFTPPQKTDLFVRGQMRARLAVSSDCADTSFYIRVSVRTARGDYALRHDITSILYQKGRYRRGEKVVLDFTFDEYAFALKAGEVLRVDVAPTDKNTYVPHTNRRGDYSRVKTCQTARNTVYANESQLILPVEKQ